MFEYIIYLCSLFTVLPVYKTRWIFTSLAGGEDQILSDSRVRATAVYR